MTMVFDTRLGNPPDLTISLPLSGSVNATIDWGDDSVEIVTIPQKVKHTYASQGQYTVTISGTVTQYGVGGSGDVNSSALREVQSFGDLGIQSINSAFSEADSLKITASLPSTVTDLSYAFSKCNASTPGISGWDVSNVTNMYGIFRDSRFNQNISDWNVAKVTDMSLMFYNARVFNQDISKWDVSSAIVMTGMFENSQEFNQDISAWDVGRVINMHNMFSRANSFNQDIGAWDVSNVTKMDYMFNDATEFNQDISQWNVSNVTTMISMFSEATSFNQNIGHWDITNVENMSYMFWEKSLSTSVYDSILILWAKQPITKVVHLDAGKSKYSIRGQSSRDTLINKFRWTITDDGLDETMSIIENKKSPDKPHLTAKHFYYPNAASMEIFNIKGQRVAIVTSKEGHPHFTIPPGLAGMQLVIKFKDQEGYSLGRPIKRFLK